MAGLDPGGPAGLTPKKRPCSSIYLVKTQGFQGQLLPVTSIYVDSFGPLYRELELRIQLATTDRTDPHIFFNKQTNPTKDNSYT